MSIKETYERLKNQHDVADAKIITEDGVQYIKVETGYRGHKGICYYNAEGDKVEEDTILFDSERKTYTVNAIEQFTFKITYNNVIANSQEEAEQRCKDRNVAYDDKEIIEGCEKWLETTSIEEE